MNQPGFEATPHRPPSHPPRSVVPESLSFILSPGSILAFLALAATLLYQVLFQLDFNLLSIPELLWNTLVYMMPSRIIVALDSISENDKRSSSGDKGPWDNAAMNHAAKSEALRRIVGWETGRFLPNFRPADSLRRISTVTKGVEDGRPAGLGNWDNSCYQNSVLQGLASLRSVPIFLREALSRDSQSTTSLRSSSRSVIAALDTMVRDLNDPLNGGRRFWTPAELKSMSSWQQQDAQEYFSKVLDEVEKEASAVVRGGQTDSGLSGSTGRLSQKKSFISGAPDADAEAGSSPHHTNYKESAKEDIRTAAKALTEATRNPLEGLLAQRVGCMRCGWSEGLSMIPFICLTVPLGGEWLYDVRECLDEYTKLEPIEGVDCAKCTLQRTKETLEWQLADLSSKAQEATPDNTQLSPGTDTMRDAAESRLRAVKIALEDDDFSESTLLNKCKIPSKIRVSTTKSRQAVIARAPKSLVIHINRSVFDEYTGAQRKNHAKVKFPSVLDLSPWCLGSKRNGDADGLAADFEEWDLDPSTSMLSAEIEDSVNANVSYEMRAVITHYGRHENGHYICYRKDPFESSPAEEADTEGKASQRTPGPRWWRISDDDVMQVTEEEVLQQGGIFMLFYDRIDCSRPTKPSSTLSENKELISEPQSEELSPATIEMATSAAVNIDADEAAEPTSATPKVLQPLASSPVSRTRMSQSAESSGAPAESPIPESGPSSSPDEIGQENTQPPPSSTSSFEHSKLPLNPNSAPVMRTATPSHNTAFVSRSNSHSKNTGSDSRSHNSAAAASHFVLAN
ncbi:MAG: hypothetical protein M4579_002961 [Chaenotheca gracillima]|nr:MAG: hypothetical protein M4579_002961 [Chaenotheca gracillima]